MKNNVYYRLVVRLFEFKSLFFRGLFFIVIVALFDAIIPLTYTWVIDNIIEVENYSLLPYFLVIFTIFAIVFAICNYQLIRTIGKIEIEFSRKLRNDLFEKIQRLQIDYFSKNDDGWIIARITGDVTKLSEVMSWQFIDVIYFFFMFSFILILIFFYSWKIGLLTLVLYPVLVAIIYFIRNKVLKNYRLVRAQNSILTSKYNELINGVQTVKTMNIEDKHASEFAEDNKKMFTYSRRALLHSALFGPITISVGYIIFASNLYASSSLFLQGAITIGTLTAIMSYILMLIESTNELTAILAEFQNAQANAERIFKLLDEEIEIEDSQEIIDKYGDIFSDVNKADIKGNVTYKDIDFSYPDSNKLFDNFNLDISSGQSVAFVGETGSGKTTLINLLTRLYEPQGGQVLIDDIDIRDRNINFIHHNIGHVLQRPQLFKGTIRENIRYNSQVSDQDIDDVIELLGIDHVIDNMERGLDTQVGEGGGRLSVGEKQLISFARAIVNNPQIIIMDEATSSIDTQSEELIQQATDKLLKNRTSFIIAHRLSTIKKCDLIVVLKKGTMIERGTHEELMNNKGYYYKLNVS